MLLAKSAELKSNAGLIESYNSRGLPEGASPRVDGFLTIDGVLRSTPGMTGGRISAETLGGFALSAPVRFACPVFVGVTLKGFVTVDDDFIGLIAPDFQSLVDGEGITATLAKAQGVGWYTGLYLNVSGLAINFIDDVITAVAGLSGFTAAFMSSFVNHLILVDVTETGNRSPQRVQWSAVGAPDDMVGTTSGFVDLADTPGIVIGSYAVLDRNIIMKTDAIYEMIHIGGDDTFSFSTLVTGIGLRDARAAKVINNVLYFVGTDNIYKYSGGNLEAIGDAVFVEYVGFRGANQTNRLERCELCDLGEKLLGIVFYDVEGNASTILIYSIQFESWWKMTVTQPLSCLSRIEYFYGLTWNEVIGTWAEQLTQWSDQTLTSFVQETWVGHEAFIGVIDFNTSGCFYASPIGVSSPTPTWDSPDIGFEWKTRVFELSAEMNMPGGNLFYSTDEGVTWVAAHRQISHSSTLGSFEEVRWVFDVTTQIIRFRLTFDASANVNKIRKMTYRYSQRKGSR